MEEILHVKLYTLDDVADLLKITRVTVNKYVKTGRLKTTVIGRKKYVREEWLKEFLITPNQEQQQPAPVENENK